MLRKILFIGMILPIFFLSSCSKEILPSNKSPILNFSANGSYLENETLINFKLDVKSNNDISLQIISPEGANGLTFKKENGKVDVSFKNLEVKNDNFNLIDGSYISYILNILESFEKNNTLNIISSENGISTYLGEIDGANFEIDVYNSSGFIKEVRFLKHNITVNLFDHKEL